ncbi:hypothetical protein [Microbacterium sp. SD291]|uniref:hypothetical protein n=1 Tax=Microbacterium sp. SD291 TaxID=2782007 RepID=UPI001A97C230|nr:hypothetical protein [Microbacterium sp. SD291]MBO0980282.1 hypothetical protein [Microbacterium sp. SD291]
MNGTDISIDEQIRSFAASVRGHLDDLPGEELDDILGGLTADLADQAADNDGVLELGDPAAYAEELRSAAGFPPRADASMPLPVRERFTAWRKRTAESIRRSAFGAWLLDFLLALRPVWWVLRGFAMFVLLAAGANGSVIPMSPASWLFALALVIVSVQWGRDRWLPKNWLRHVRTAVSVVAVAILPFALVSALTPRVEYLDSGSYPQPGLLLDGVQVNNIFAYDAEGDPIEQVQLFTGKGTPLNLYGEGGGQIEFRGGTESEYGIHDDGEYATIPLQDYRGQAVWNVYPLDEARMDFTTGLPKSSTTKSPKPPFLRAPSIDTADPSPSPSPTPGPTEPQPTPTPAP